MKKVFIPIVIAMAFFTSCDKVKTAVTPTATTSSTPTAPQPTITGGDAALVAVNTKITNMVVGIPVELEIGTGVGVFGNLSTPSYVDVGSITLNTKALTKQSNNTYLFTPSATEPTGIDLSGSLNWSVAGGNGFSAFTCTSSKSMPNADMVSGTYTTVDKSSTFTLSTNSSISNADSVYFQLSGPNGTVLKRMGSNVSSATFSLAEVQSVGTGSGSVVIAPWNMEQQTKGGKAIILVNETAVARVVEIK